MIRKRIEEYVRGWLPKTPLERSGVAATTHIDPRLRFVGNMFSNFGIFLVVLIVFRFVIQIFMPTFMNPLVVRPSFTSNFQLIFAAGFILMVVGMTLRAGVDPNVEYLKSLKVRSGLTLLTVCVFGLAFNTMLGFYAPNITLPKYGASLAANVVLSFVGFAGLLLLARGRTALSNSASFPRKTFSIMSAGIMMNLIVTPIVALLVFGSLWHPSITGTVVPGLVLVILTFSVMPLGTVFSIYGWSAIFSSSAKRHKSLLLTVLAIFAVLIIASLVI